MSPTASSPGPRRRARRAAPRAPRSIADPARRRYAATRSPSRARRPSRNDGRLGQDAGHLLRVARRRRLLSNLLGDLDVGLDHELARVRHRIHLRMRRGLDLVLRDFVRIRRHGDGRLRGLARPGRRSAPGLANRSRAAGRPRRWARASGGLARISWKSSFLPESRAMRAISFCTSMAFAAWPMAVKARARRPRVSRSRGFAWKADLELGERLHAVVRAAAGEELLGGDARVGRDRACDEGGDRAPSVRRRRGPS